MNQKQILAAHAVICFTLAAGYALYGDDHKFLVVGICLLVGVVTSIVATSGFWRRR